MHRLSLVADLLHPAQLRAAVRPHPGGPGTRQALGGALRCGASVALAFLLVAAVGRRDLAGYAALGALASLYGRSSGYAWRLRLMGLVGAALAAAVAVMSAVSAAGAPVVVELAALTLLAAGATAGAAALRTGPPGATILVFAAGAGAAPGGDALPRTAAVLAGALLAVLVCTAGALPDRWRGRPADPAPALRDVVRSGTAGGAALGPALTVAVAAALASAVAVVAGRGHPAWAVMGAAAVLQGTHVQHMGVRALQRAAGTACGVALAWPLLGADLGFVAVAALVVVLQTVTELVVARHYGVAMLTITPMALLMTSLGAVADPAALALDRALDTAVGALVGLVVAVAAARPERAAPEPAAPAAATGGPC